MTAGREKQSRSSKGENHMKTTFYDVKKRQKVQAEITEKVKYGKRGNERYAVRGKTADGRNLTKFMSKADWDKVTV